MYDYVLRTSLEEHKIIDIIYLKENEITQRKVKILKIEGNDIEAYCYLRKEIRHFKTDNILSAVYTH